MCDEVGLLGEVRQDALDRDALGEPVRAWSAARNTSAIPPTARRWRSSYPPTVAATRKCSRRATTRHVEVGDRHRSPVEAASLLVDVGDVVLLDQAVQVHAIEAAFARRLRHVAAGAPQQLRDVVALPRARSAAPWPRGSLRCPRVGHCGDADCGVAAALEPEQRRAAARGSAPISDRPRSITFFSSRTLPGQSYSVNSAIVSGGTSTSLPARKCCTSGATSLLALAQRRQRHAHDGEPMIEIVAEAPRLDLFAQVAVGRGDDAHVDVAIAARAPTGLTLRDSSARKRRGCMSSSSSPISSMKMVPPCACCEGALAIAVGAGEGAAHVAEQLRLDQRARHAGQIADDERPLARAGPPTRMASAHSSLPVPVSPSMSTATSDCATSSSTANTSRIFSDGPSSAPKRSARRRHDRVRALDRGQLELGAADGDDGAGTDGHLGEARAAEEAAVGRAEIFDEHARLGDRSSRCWRETEPSREHEVAAGRLADEVGAALEHELLAGVGAGEHEQAQLVGDRDACPGSAMSVRGTSPCIPFVDGHAPTLARDPARSARATSSRGAAGVAPSRSAPPVENSFHAERSCCARIFWSSS